MEHMQGNRRYMKWERTPTGWALHIGGERLICNNGSLGDEPDGTDAQARLVELMVHVRIEVDLDLAKARAFDLEWENDVKVAMFKKMDAYYPTRLTDPIRILHGPHPQYWVCPHWVALELEAMGYEVIQ